jgi:hypothetical protein
MLLLTYGSLADAMRFSLPVLEFVDGDPALVHLV